MRTCVNFIIELCEYIQQGDKVRWVRKDARLEIARLGFMVILPDHILV